MSEEVLDLDADAAPLLHAACRRGDVADVRQILLAHGSALLNSVDHQNATPLNHAVYHGGALVPARITTTNRRFSLSSKSILRRGIICSARLTMVRLR